MFICDNCKTQVPANTPSHKVVTKTREKVYPARPRFDDPGGVGHETVQELCLCPDCACNPTVRMRLKQ